MYADDGLIYGAKAPEEVTPETDWSERAVSLDALLKKDMSDSGVQVHPEKSAWVKKDGK